ncbi:hypothetical protein DVH24_031786 [Malus domestica]|uniref:Prenyltransferase alpha-alpha toroid domain-containing protein n=1 Tax=Malus domestica TaxID=3750 RepID=A0A498J154_MALDO|nr:hypothetical protein DVH24_031786 [Malus domestica]
MERPTATVTQRDQWMVESEVFGIYGCFGSLPPKAQSVMIELHRDSHIEYLTRGLRGLPSSFCVLDANRPWLCYWILHSLALLGESIDDELERNAIDFLSRCQDPEGGYGGGPGQMPHLATTYAAVNALITFGGDEALSSINRGELYKFLRRMKHPSGGFRMHDGGEIDVRACYTAVASILNILDDELVHNVGSFILSCQTYEGGISGEPGAEAHGGVGWYFDKGRSVDFRGGLINWSTVATPSGSDQGGVFPLLQRVCPTIDEQLELRDAGGHCTKDGPQTSTKSNLSEEGKNFEGTTSPGGRLTA